MIKVLGHSYDFRVEVQGLMVGIRVRIRAIMLELALDVGF